jgi:protein involved in polysaccharide export with SLBB domain
MGRVRKPGCWVALVLLAGAGCSTGSSAFSLFPEGHRLIPAAKALRSAYPEPLPLPRELDKRAALPYAVEPGDVLLVQPASLDSPARLPGDQPVLPDGSINLGRYGRLLVAGKTVDQIEAEVRPLVEAQTKDAGPITVRIITRQSKVYYVLGEVNAPGAFPLQGRETVLDAIVAAGGLNDRASRKSITLSRPTKPGECRVVLPVCYEEIVQVGDTSTNYQIAAGDRIYVPTRECKPFWNRKGSCPPCGGPQAPCPAPPDHLDAQPGAFGLTPQPRPYPAALVP